MRTPGVLKVTIRLVSETKTSDNNRHDWICLELFSAVRLGNVVANVDAGGEFDRCGAAGI